MSTKKILMSFLLCLMAGYSFGQDFCMYVQGEKVCYEISPISFLITSTTLDAATIEHELQNTIAGNVKSVNDFGGGGIFYVEMDNSTREKILELRRQWDGREDVIYTSPVILDGRGKNLCGYMNEVIVMLKSNDDYPVLEKLVEEYQIIDIQLEPLLSSQTYVLTLAHNAEKDAMQTSLELYETGLFEYAQPNFMYLWLMENGNAYYPDNDIPFAVYPNPANDVLYVEMTDESASKISIYSLQGAKVLQAVMMAHKAQIDISLLPNGIYFLHLYDPTTGKQGIKKIVIKH
jgi:hypothetical protein